MFRRPWIMLRERLTHGLTEEEMREARKSRHNERVKLLATALNGLAVGIGTTGIVGPIVALFLKAPGAPLSSSLAFSTETLVFIAVWIALGFVLHLGAQIVLGLLR